MKYKFTIITISLLIIAFISYILFFRCSRKLPEFSNYTIVSNRGAVIPAKLYLRNKKSMVNGNEKKIEEFILSFSDSLINNDLNLSGDDKLYKFLVVVPNQKIIGLVNDMNALTEKDKCICQANDDADSFTSIINNRTFFNKPPITNASFTNKKVVFNTYGILKQFGESIIVEIH